ncbi:MAG: YggT family protein [Candidatus Levyibacteriota bacterium]
MSEEIIERVTTTTAPSAETTKNPQKVLAKKKAIFRTYQVIWYILAIVEILLGFRMVLKALGANPLSGFVNLIYTLSDPLALPFVGILHSSISGVSVFEWSTLIAAVVYAILAYGVVYLIQIVKPVTPSEVSEKVDNP